MPKYNIKYLVKSILPNRLLFYVRRARSLTSAWNYWSAYVFKDGRANPPAALTFELTYRCNLKCRMCPQATDLLNPESVLREQMKENKELSTEEVINVIDQAGAMGVKRITITGGEPFVRRDIMEILSAVKRNRMACYIISNGGLMSERYAMEIVKIGVDKITFSLDGPEDIHNDIRQNSHQFQDLLNAIRSLQAEKKAQRRNIPDLTLNMTVSAMNAGRLSEMVEIATQEKVNLNYGFLFYTSKEMEQRTRKVYQATGGKMEDQDVLMSLRTVDVNVLTKDIKKAEKKAAMMHVKINFQPYIKEPEDLYCRFYDDNHAYVNTCFYPWFATRINPYGDVYPCQMNVKSGNVREKKLPDIWNNDIYIRFRKELRSVGIWPKCAKCCALNDKLWDRLPKMHWYWDKKQPSKILHRFFRNA